jgi:hypothetical protein
LDSWEGGFGSDDGVSSTNLRNVTLPGPPGKGKLFRLLRIPFLGTLSSISFVLEMREYLLQYYQPWYSVQ